MKPVHLKQKTLYIRSRLRCWTQFPLLRSDELESNITTNGRIFNIITQYFMSHYKLQMFKTLKWTNIINRMWKLQT